MYPLRTKKFSHTKAKSKVGLASAQSVYSLHDAILNDDIDTLENLINTGVNLNLYDINRNTPLLLAVRGNKAKILAKLLEEGADLYIPDANQNSPLELAIRLNHQESIDILTEHGALQVSTTNKKVVKDDSFEFVTALVKLLGDEINHVTSEKKNVRLGCQVLALLQQYLNFGGVPEEIVDKLNLDITSRITQFISHLKNDAKISDREVLNLARKIICVIQDCKQSMPAKMEWSLSKIESLIEEKIVLSHSLNKKTESHVFVYDTSPKKGVAAARREDWYVRNGYKDFDEFVKVNSTSAGKLQFLRFSNITREKILQMTNCRSPEMIELVTIRPLQLRSTEEFSLLLQDGLQRLKEEAALFDKQEGYQILLDKAKNGAALSLDESNQLDKILRPGKQNKMHIVHFHHTNSYEDLWDDFTKESFITGASIYLFNPPSKSTRDDVIYSGIAIVNKLLDEDIHPDKIILQGYGAGYLASKEVKKQFQKRGLKLTQVNYQHSSFSPASYPDFICDHRHLHIYEHLSSKQNILNKEYELQEFAQFAESIAKHLSKMRYSSKTTALTAVTSDIHSLTQILNSFITASQLFLKGNVDYKNPALPDERVETILGMAEL